MSLVNITIDGAAFRVDSEFTILQAAQQEGIHVPTLCHLPSQSIKAVCRVCMVEASGKLVPSCSTNVAEGMCIKTKGGKIEKIRKTSLELLLSNHPMHCQHCARNGASEVAHLSDEMCGYCRFCDCVQDGVCELQSLAREMNVTFGNFTWVDRNEDKDESLPSFYKDPNKCILCRRCVGACSEQQGVNVWCITERGDKTRIVPVFGEQLKDSGCVQCGLCVRECPTGALAPKQQADNLYCITDNRNLTVIACIDPYFIQEFSRLGEYADLNITEKNLVAGLHRVGIDLVWQGADMAFESIKALIEEMEESTKSPLIGCSSFSAKELAQRMFPDGHHSSSLRAQQRFGHFAKEIWAKQNQINKENIFCIALTSDISGKAEAGQAEMQGVDLVLTPIEVRRMFLRRGADLRLLAPEEYDMPSTIASGLGLQSEHCGVTEFTWKGDKKIAVANGLNHSAALLNDAKAGNSPYDLIYLTAIPGGSVDFSATLEILKEQI